jgi:hypothetical protein
MENVCLPTCDEIHRIRIKYKFILSKLLVPVNNVSIKGVPTPKFFG